ncbi:hypothetical protein N7508_006495 [Penicillium antarcticum]|uniref:uncharacterized protein n=1 Tax=Penicillium antarcticum TaxID=416450 RepID=UPI00238797CD|nr:uncharacterized protein N7508_006495 [Penicillium antarcticum]KAJ5301632.1 hypothetical protein N7508_006495 [Penicillium antarcticum]
MDDSPDILGWLPHVNPENDHSTLFDLMIPSDKTLFKSKHDIQLNFINNQDDVRGFSSENAARHRQSIFTGLNPKFLDYDLSSDASFQESERYAMSEELSSSVPNRNIHKALSDLESFNLHGDSHAPLYLFRGPFGALRLSQSEMIESTTPESPDWDKELENILRGEDFDLDDVVVPELTANNNRAPQKPVPSQLDDMELCSFEPQIQPQINLYGGNVEGWTLLSHYKDRIVPLISPLRRGQETPWVSLVIPCAVTTLGELTLNGSINHARLALLNAVWGTSAFHLGNNTSCLGNWKASGEMYLRRAQCHFQKCMEEQCLSTAKTSKYKEILMAVLSLSNAFMFKGDPTRRRAYLVQTEKFIRVRGLSQPKLSSKKRALHHCYAFMRIIAETTCVADSPNVQLFETSGGAIGDKIYEGDFRISPNLVFSADAMTEEKDPEMGQRDLHLAIPGRWSSTLFPTVYGVDELFLMLLSQVIRLANERDLSTMCNRTQEGRLSLKEFWIRAKAIEKAINTLISSSVTGDTQAYHSDSPMKDKSTTAQAMSMSLLIFFYRRIYEVDPAILQCKVAIMRTYLRQIQEEETISGNGSNAALIWPAFIAACEAVESDLQLFFSSWFDHCFATTALVYASAAKEIFETIWMKRLNAEVYGETLSWPDILREGNIRFTCV